MNKLQKIKLKLLGDSLSEVTDGDYTVSYKNRGVTFMNEEKQLEVHYRLVDGFPRVYLTYVYIKLKGEVLIDSGEEIKIPFLSRLRRKFPYKHSYHPVNFINLAFGNYTYVVERPKTAISKVQQQLDKIKSLKKKGK